MTDLRENVWPKYSSQISGGWKCISYELHSIPSNSNEAPTVHKPHGGEPLGRVLISPNGWLAAHIANPTRFGPLPSGAPWQSAPDAEIAHVARGLSMYCGYLQLFEDSEGLYWETRVEISSDPVRKGGLEVRRVALESQGEGDGEGEGKGGRSGKVMTMTLRPVRDMVMEDGTKTRGVLKWEKFE